eukprot:4163445-Pyramimonas_sp.AAC.1
MKIDGRQGGTFKEEEVANMEVEEEEQSGAQIGEINWACEHENEDRGHKHQLTWTRKDYGTRRLMLPGPSGPQW